MAIANRLCLGYVFREFSNINLYPIVSMLKEPGVHVSANFGQQEFVFDIDSETDGFFTHEELKLFSI